MKEKTLSFGKFTLKVAASLLVINICLAALIFFSSQIYHLWTNGLVIEIPAVGYALIFAHGDYGHYSGVDYAHITYLDGQYHDTEMLLDYFHKKGYQKIWVSMCSTGNNQYIKQHSSGEAVLWPDYVDRNRLPGITIPLYAGIGFHRI
jgi:hypothetical protein